MDVDYKDSPRFAGDFYRDKYRKVLNYIILEIIIIIGLFAAITYTIFFQATPLYYVSTTNGIVLPLQGGKVALDDKG